MKMRIIVSNHEVKPERMSFTKRPDQDYLMDMERPEHSDYYVYVSEFVERNRRYFQSQISEAGIICMDKTFPDFFLHKIAVAFSQFAQLDEKNRRLYSEERKMIHHLTAHMPDFIKDDFTIYRLNDLITERIAKDALKRIKSVEKIVAEQEAEFSINRKQPSSISELVQ